MEDIIISPDCLYPIVKVIILESSNKKMINVLHPYLSRLKTNKINSYNTSKYNIKFKENVRDRYVVDMEDK